MPTAVLRRYTPPTCTLEIAAAGSALSRWTDRTVVKNLRFQLSFDDPKLLPNEQIAVSGDQIQLETLCDVVGRYVESLLATSAGQVPWEPCLRSLAGSSEATPKAALNSVSGSALAAASSAELETTELTDASLSSRSAISLQIQGLLKHRLNLGSLANAESGEFVSLTTLQLFDLANALEAYQTEAVSLPQSERPAWLRSVPSGWPSMAAAGLLALGITGGLAKFVLDVSRPTVQTASAPQERQVNSELNRELFPTLSPPPIEPSPTITLQPLPPPPPAGAVASPGATAPGLPPGSVTQPPANPQTAADSTASTAGIGAAGSAPGSTPGSAPGSGVSGTDSSQSVTIFPNPTVASAPTAPFSSASSEPPRLAPTEAEASRADAASTTTAFDTIPQVAEIRSYFQQNWQPPDGLDQTLEYRLLLNADGSLQRIVPLGQFSENYLDRTSMPLMGEPFVSPTGDGSTPQIRLVLKPDGKVQSFLEYAN